MPADTPHIPVPTTRVQFSTDQLKPIFIGLDDLVEENSHVRDTGSLRRYPDLPDEYDRFGCRQAPPEEQMSAVLSAHAKIRPRVETGGWVRLDHRELAACALAVSHAKRLVRKKDSAPWAPNYNKLAKRLHTSIEQYRKRAIRLLPSAAQKCEREKIVVDLRVVRERLAPSPVERKWPRMKRRYLRELVDKAQRLAIVGLGMRGFEPPADLRELKTLVRARMRNYARKTSDDKEESVGARARFLSDEISAALTLADYIISHCDKLVRRRTPVENPPKPQKLPMLNDGAACPEVLGHSAPPPNREELPPSVRIVISELEWLRMEDFNGQSAWSRMSRSARVDAVAKAKQAGGKDLSNRRIARIIGVNDKTVARMLREAKLPEEVRTAVLRGNKSGNQALREAKDPVYQQSKRLWREKKDASVSSAHAEQIVSYVRRFGLSREAVTRAKELLSGPKAPTWLQTHVPCTDVENVIRKSEAIAVDGGCDDLAIEIPARRLCWWLVRVAPERAIHNGALDKAMQALPTKAQWGTKG